MFLAHPPLTDAATDRFAAEQRDAGFVMNLSRLWAWRPDVDAQFGALRAQLMGASSLQPRDYAVMVAAAAGALGDAYCSLAYGARLARMTDAATAAAVLRDAPAPALGARETALAAWARKIVRTPGGTTPADVDALRAAGLGEREIFECTAFVALRLAFSTVNSALGAQPDPQLHAHAPEEVRRAVDYGRPVATAAS